MVVLDCRRKRKKLANHGVNIYEWQREGYVTITDGNAVDIEQVISDIASIGPEIRLQTVARDPWGSVTNTLKMQEVGMNVVDYRQGYHYVSTHEDLERLTAIGQIAHGGNPVARWMLGNVEVERDAAGNIKPSRKRKENKIDGIVAAIMALGEAIAKTPVGNQSYLLKMI